jgi:hypothetical protein
MYHSKVIRLWWATIMYFQIDISINSGDAICTFSDIYLEAQANGATQYNWSTGDVGSVTIVQSNTAGPPIVLVRSLTQRWMY